MAGTGQTELDIVIKAIDEASATLKQIANNSTQANGQVAASSEKAGLSFAELTGSIWLAEEAHKAFDEVLGATKDFLEESMGAAVKASAVMAQVKVDVENAGLSYTKLAPQIAEVAQKNESLGFTQEDTQLSLGRLMLATGDYTDAVKLNSLAMDLSRAKGIDLNTATTLLQQVMAGNTRVMKQYGISLDSATTSGEALDLLHQKLQGSATAFADTAAGHLAQVKAQWEEIQIQVGEQLMPLFDELYRAFEDNLPAITADMENLAKAVIDAVQFMKDMVDYGKQLWHLFEDLNPTIKVLESALGVLGESLKSILNTLDAVLSAQEKANEAADQASAVAKRAQDDYQKLADAYNKVNKAQITVADLNTTTAKGMALIRQAQADLATQNGATANSFDDISNRIRAADNAMVKHADAVAKLGDEYTKLRDTANTDLADIANQFSTKMATIQDSIAKTQQSITDLTEAYNTARTNDTQTVADKIVASEQKIATLKAEILKASSGDQQLRLQDELAAEQKNYDSSLAFRQTHLSEMAAAEKEASLTDLQRTINDYNTKEAKAKEEYDKKLKILQDTLADQQKAAQDEIDLTKAKLDKISGFLNTAQAEYIKQSNDRVAQTTKEVDAEIKMYQALAAAISAAKSANAQSISTIGASLPHFASGGIVNGPTIALVGEAGPEAIVPLSLLGSGGSSGGGFGGITINISGGQYYTDRQSVVDFANQIARILNAQLKLRNYAS